MSVKKTTGAAAGLITFHTSTPISTLQSLGKPEGGDQKNVPVPLSVSESRRSCLRNRTPCPSKGVGRRRATADWLSHSSIRRLQANLETGNREARLITQPLLDTESGFVKDLDSYLSHRGTLELRKRELLHKRWTERVWTPIQKRVEEHLSLCCCEEAERMRSDLLRYVEHCNAKGFVSLETYDPNEYDPFLHHINRPHFFKVSTPALNDPLLHQSRERTKEIRTLLRCQTGAGASAVTEPVGKTESRFRRPGRSSADGSSNGLTGGGRDSGRLHRRGNIPNPGPQALEVSDIITEVSC